MTHLFRLGGAFCKTVTVGTCLHGVEGSGSSRVVSPVPTRCVLCVEC